MRFVPVGNYEKAKENSYHRVYNDDGMFTYPKLTKNIMREKGQTYWVDKTLCGSEIRRPRK